MRKPRPIKLIKNYEFRSAFKQYKMIYLYKADTDEHIWIEGVAKMKRLHAWLGRAIKYAEGKK